MILCNYSCHIQHINKKAFSSNCGIPGSPNDESALQIVALTEEK